MKILHPAPHQMFNRLIPYAPTAQNKQAPRLSPCTYVSCDRQNE